METAFLCDTGDKGGQWPVYFMIGAFINITRFNLAQNLLGLGDEPPALNHRAGIKLLTELTLRVL